MSTEPVASIVLTAGFDEQPWAVDARCAETDPDAFFPEKGGSTREAKKVCVTCDVREQCLEWALARNEQFGIWGGLSERERRRLQKDRNAAGINPQRLCTQCGTTPVERRPGTPDSTQYCEPCATYRQAVSTAKNSAITRGLPMRPIHRWQNRPRPHLGHTSEGTTATGAAHMAGVPVPTTPLPSGRDVVSDIERAHRTHLPVIPTQPATPNTTEAAMPLPKQCLSCDQYTDKPLSKAGWCSWCEDQAAATALAKPAPPKPNVLDGLPGKTPAAPATSRWPAELTALLVDTEGYPDPDIRALRKSVANAAVKLHLAWKKAQGQPIPRLEVVQSHAAETGAKAPKSQAVIDDIVRLTKEGMPQAAIAQRLGIGVGTVNKYQRVNGVSRGRTDCGTGIKHAASRLADLSLKPSIVRQWAREHGIDVAARGAVPGHVIDAFITAHKRAAS
ncbi:WhiB family transcriptional regulator [Angustibacter sp. McL0619]|uniref:WhiB family transcriptional regulator n=1 Tax=Angustibacter sp. McL0619 TaxID=3415676 RepID=UPI003CF559EB